MPASKSVKRKMQNNNPKLKTRKTILGILLLLILFSSVSFYPTKAEAGLPVIDWVAIGAAIAEFAKDASEKTIDILTAVFRKMILDIIVNEIIAWISGEGTSAFDTGDWGQFFDEAAQQAGGKALEEITGAGVMTQLCDADWAGQVRINLQPLKKFGQKARCTLRDIGVNYDNFIENFENGGWAAWIKISESQNNPYGYFLSAVNEKLAKETQKKLGLEKELTASGGFLSDEVCIKEVCEAEKNNGICPVGFDDKNGVCEMTIFYTSNENRKEADSGKGCKCVKTETRTPGKIMADSLSRTIFKDYDWLQKNSEWYNYAVAIGNAVVNRLTKEGVRAIKAAVRPGQPTSVSMGITSKADYTAPTTLIKILNPWRAKLTSSEPGDTYYTLDGSKPRLRASPKYEGGELTIVSSTALNAAPAQLKWLSVDDNFNAEDVRSLPAFLRSPFDYNKLTEYLDNQNVNVPDSLKEALMKFFEQEENGEQAAKISKETFIPKDIRNALKDYLGIEDLRIELGKIPLLSSERRLALDNILATYDNLNPADDGKLTDLIAVLAEIKSAGISAFADVENNAVDIRNRRDNLKSTLTTLNGVIAALETCSKAQKAATPQEGETAEDFQFRIVAEFNTCQNQAQTGLGNLTLANLSSALASDPLFNELKEKTDKIILENSLFAVDPTPGNWTGPSAALAPADPEHVVILSFDPSKTGNYKSGAIFYKQASWLTGDGQGRALTLFSSQKNGFYYKQALDTPPNIGTQIWYGAIDANNNWTKEEAAPEFSMSDAPSLAKLPAITDFVKPIADIRTPIVKDGEYFILNPLLSVDNDRTPRITGYEWNFIDNGTTTSQYEWESFDLNRDGIFETQQCLYNFLAGAEQVITGPGSQQNYYKVAGSNQEVYSLSLRKEYYDAAHSSPYPAPNTTLLNLNLQPTCVKLAEASQTKYYLETYENNQRKSSEEITQTVYNQKLNSLSTNETKDKFDVNIASNSYKRIYIATNLINTGDYEDMKIVDANNGIIKVKFTADSGPITIGLRVTDDEGLTAVDSVVINP